MTPDALPYLRAIDHSLGRIADALERLATVAEEREEERATGRETCAGGRAIDG